VQSFVKAKREVENLQIAFTSMDPRTVQQFSPVAKRWRSILVRESAAEIPNPYIAGNPLQSEETKLFVGRADLFQAIEAAVYAPHGKLTLALYGPRRAGKTTVLLHLPRLLPEEIVPVFVDLQAVGQVKSEGGFYFALANAMVRDAHKHRQLDLPKPDLALFTAEPTLALTDWLDNAEAILGERSILLTMDEFERLGEALYDSGQSSQTIMDEFERLKQVIEADQSKQAIMGELER
jgi:hypothetical protein